MKIFPGAFSFVIVAIATLGTSGCKKDKDKEPDIMEISSFFPAEGSAGDTITVSGKKFSADKAGNLVQINGVAIEVYKASTTELAVVLPERVTSGAIKVKAGDDSASTTSHFIVSAAIATLTSFVPDHGEWGTVVTVSGKKMLSDAEVFYDGTKITEFEPGRNLNALSFRIPPGAKAGKISITQSGATKEFPARFKVTNTWEKLSRNTLGFQLMNGISFVHDGSIYFGMGAIGTNNNQEFYRYDTSDHKWYNAFHAPGTGQHATIFRYDNYFFVSSGVLANGRNQVKWYYFEPEYPNAWGSLPEWDFASGNNGCATFVVNGKIFSGFGMAGPTLYRWDRSDEEPATWQWVKPQHYLDPSLCLYYASSFVLGNDVYVGAGFNACGSYPGTRYFKLNPEKGTQTAIASLPENVTFSNAFSMNGKGYVVTENGGFYEYDPVADTWTIKGSTGLASRYAAVVDGRIFAWNTQGDMAEYIPNY